MLKASAYALALIACTAQTAVINYVNSSNAFLALELGFVARYKYNKRPNLGASFSRIPCMDS